MKEALKYIIEDIRSGRNIDHYILIALAIIVAILSILERAASSVINASILAVLAILIYGRLQDRRRLDTLVAKERLHGIRMFYPNRLLLPSLDATLSSTKHEIFIIGFSLSHLIHTQRGTLENIALEGCKIKLAAWTPPSEEPQRTLLIKSIEELVELPDLEGFLNSAITRLKHWYNNLDEKVRQNIELRGYTTTPTATVLFMDSDYPYGYVRIEPILYRVASQDIPSFELGVSDDPGLYHILKEKYLKLWNEAQSLVK